MWLVREHPRALNVDLMKIGSSLRDVLGPSPFLRVGDLLDLLEYADPSMAVYRTVFPDWEWDLTNQLLAALFDQAQMQAWNEGGRKGPRPKPLPRPGVGQKTTKKRTTRRKYSMAEIDAHLASRVKPN